MSLKIKSAKKPQTSSGGKGEGFNLAKLRAQAGYDLAKNNFQPQTGSSFGQNFSSSLAAGLATGNPYAAAITFSIGVMSNIFSAGKRRKQLEQGAQQLEAQSKQLKLQAENTQIQIEDLEAKQEDLFYEVEQASETVSSETQKVVLEKSAKAVKENFIDLAAADQAFEEIGLIKAFNQLSAQANRTYDDITTAETILGKQVKQYEAASERASQEARNLRGEASDVGSIGDILGF